MAARRRRDGLLVLVTGSRGSGKSGWSRQQVGHRPRLLVWDAMKEWSRDGIVQPVRSLKELHRLIILDLHHPGEFRYGYTGPVTRKAFVTFCKLATVFMKAEPEGCVVIEELADVTNVGKAPEGWGEMVREGRHYSGDIYALTQRPTESDKTVAGNCDIIHAGRQSFPGDRKTMAEYLSVPVKQVDTLENLHWIERDMRDGRVSCGVLTFSGSRRKK
jgi:hypothetical protein